MPAINLSLTFCVDTNTENILNSPIGQPMAAILFSRVGQRGTLVIWSFVVITQYVTLGLRSAANLIHQPVGSSGIHLF